MADEQKMTFEASLKRLDEIVKQLEAGEVSLEESIVLFEEGTALSKLCSEQLEEAKLKVRILTQTPTGELTEEEFKNESE